MPLCVWDLFLFSNLVSNSKRLRGASDFITVQEQFICCLWDPGLDVLGSKRLLPSPLPLGWFEEFRGGLEQVSAHSHVLSPVSEWGLPGLLVMRDSTLLYPEAEVTIGRQW